MRRDRDTREHYRRILVVMVAALTVNSIVVAGVGADEHGLAAESTGVDQQAHQRATGSPAPATGAAADGSDAERASRQPPDDRGVSAAQPPDQRSTVGDETARDANETTGGSDPVRLRRVQTQGDPEPTFADRQFSDDVIELGESVTATIAVQNDGGRAGNWSTISVSFPTLDEPGDDSQITITDTTFDGHRGVATAGDTIVDSDGEEVTAEYALAEAGTGADGTWAAGETHSITVEVTPTESGTFQFYMRGTLTAEDDEAEKFTVPSGSLTEDQQGYPVYVWEIEVVDELAVSTDEATGVTQNGATLYGAIDDRGRDAPVDVGFEYREEGADEWQETSAKTYENPQAYQIELDGLDPGTTYEYRALGDNGAATARGEPKTFTTTGEPDAPPEVRTGGASAVDADSAVLEGDLLDQGSETPVQVRFEYRKRGSDEWQRTANTSYLSPTAVSRELDGLDPGTTYEYRVVAESDAGTDEGNLQSFTTDERFANVNAEIVGYDSPTSGEQYELDKWYDVAVTVRNTGEDEREFVLQAHTPSGTEVREENKTVTIPPGSTETVVFAQRWYGTYTPTRTFSHDLYVRSSDGQRKKLDTASVTLERPPVGTTELRFATADGNSPRIDYRIIDENGTAVVDSTVTGGNGKVHTLKTGTYTVEATAQGYKASSVEVDVQKDRTVIDKLTLVPEAAHAEIVTDSFTVEEGDYEVNDSVRASVTVRNTGSVSHEFFVGLSVRSGEADGQQTEYGPTGKLVELAPGEERTVDLSWRVNTNAPPGGYNASASIWYGHPEVGAEQIQATDWQGDQFYVVRDAYEEQLEYQGTTYTLVHKPDDTILVLDENRERVDADTARDVLYYEAFRRYSYYDPSTYRTDLWELTEQATNMEVYYVLAHGTEAAITLYKAYVTTQVTGQPAYGEVLDMTEQIIRLNKELSQSDALAEAANSHVRSAQVAHKYYSNAKLAAEYGPKVKQAYQLKQAGKADTYVDALKQTMSQAEWREFKLAVAKEVAWAGFDDATAGLKITAKQSLVLMNWGKASQLQLDMLSRLAEKRENGTITRAEMDLYFWLKVSYDGSTAAMADRVLELQQAGENESLAFKYLSGLLTDRDNKQIYRETRDLHRWLVEDTLERHGQFRATAANLTNSSANIHDEPQASARFAAMPLAVQIPDHVAPGEPITATVTSRGTPVPNAKIEVGEKIYTTDQQGQATVRLLKAGQYTVTVRKDGFETVERPIRASKTTRFVQTFDSVEIGEHAQTQEITASTALNNTGDAVLEIAEVTTSSDGLEAEVDSTAIEPGESVTLTVTIDGRQFEPGILSEAVTIQWAGSNDSTEIAVSGELVDQSGNETTTDETRDDGGTDDEVTDDGSTGDGATSQPAQFTPLIVETNAPVEVDKFLKVTAEVENTGDEPATQEIALDIGDQEAVDTATVDLDGGEATTVTLRYDTADVESSTLNVTVRSADDEATTSVPVSQPDDATATSVTIERPTGNDPATVAANDSSPLTVEARLKVEPEVIPEPGAVERRVREELPVQVPVTVEVGGVEAPVTNVDVRPATRSGDVVEIPLIVTARPRVSDPGMHDLTVSLELPTPCWPGPFSDRACVQTVTEISDTEPNAVEVIDGGEPAQFTVTTVETNAPVEVDELLEVTAEVENTGNEPATREVTLDVGDRQGVDTASVDLDGNASTTVTLTYDTADVEPGEHDVTVRSDDESATTTVDVIEPGTDEPETNETNESGADDPETNESGTDEPQTDEPDADGSGSDEPEPDYGIEMRDVTGDGSDDVRLSNGRVQLQLHGEDLDSRTYVSALGRDNASSPTGPWRFKPATRTGDLLEFQSTESFAVVADNETHLAYRVVRRYAIDDVPFRVTYTVSLLPESEFAIVETEWTNLGSREVRLDQEPSNVHDGVVLLKGVALADPAGEYRFHVSGSGTHAFDEVGTWRTFQASADPPFVTVFDDETGVTYALLDGATGHRHVVTNGQPADKVDFMVQEVTVAPDETVEYVMAIGAHDGGDAAVTQAGSMVEDAERALDSLPDYGARDSEGDSDTAANGDDTGPDSEDSDATGRDSSEGSDATDGPADANGSDEEDVTDGSIERITPVEREVTVAPDTDVLFEVAATDYPGTVYSTSTEWFVDGERQYADNAFHAGYTGDGDFYRTQFTSTGTHEVRVVAYGEDGEEELGTVTWTIHVEEGAYEAPSVERVTPEDEEVAIEDDAGKSLDFTLSASDPDGDLHRVLWWEAECDYLLETTDIGGSRDEATVTLTAAPDTCPVFAWVVDERGMVTRFSGWSFWSSDSDESDDDSWHTLTIDGQNTGSRTDYSITVSGKLEAKEGIGTGDSIHGPTAEGFTRGGTDVYRFTGELERHELEGGDAVLTVDGERRGTADGESEAEEKESEKEWHTLTIDGQNTGSRTDYTVEVSGELEAAEGVGTGDSIHGSTAEGFTRGGTDTYRFTGELEDFHLDGGDAVLTVDGERREAADD